mmetsp:Transcript_124287/g.194715  ORF Transcript_124287/g.194715 Transcript_124287/m.194715 type:complete len:207 (-) Transcript_124287:20-640(-)
MNSYRDTPRVSKTKQKYFPSCVNVSYMMAHLEVLLGSASRTSFKMAASILAFSIYRLTSRMILMATSRSCFRSYAPTTRPNVPSPSALRSSYRELSSISLDQSKWIISSLPLAFFSVATVAFFATTSSSSSNELLPSESLEYAELKLDSDACEGCFRVVPPTKAFRACRPSPYAYPTGLLVGGAFSSCIAPRGDQPFFFLLRLRFS